MQIDILVLKYSEEYYFLKMKHILAEIIWKMKKNSF